MAILNGFMSDTEETSFGYLRNTLSGVEVDTNGGIGRRERYVSVRLERLPQYGSRKNYTFGGLNTDSDDSIGYRQPNVYRGFSIDDNDVKVGERKRIVASVYVDRLFAWDGKTDNSKRGIRLPNQLTGVTTWGDGTIPPRRYPLESTWKMTKK